MRRAIYREGEHADIDPIIRFQLAMAEETEQFRLDPEICARGVRAVFENPSLGRYYVCELDGVVVASLLITYEWSDWRNGEVWWIQSVYVIPEVRRQGVYTGLYSHLENLARTDDRVRGIRLYVDRRNTSAQQVYRKLGMNGEHYQVFEWMK
jgi:GNAT superfamily N-acetyltransferase